MIENKRHGDSVTFLIPNGLGRDGQEWKKKTGKVAMKFKTHLLVVNGGGRFGTPYVVDGNNFVK